MQTAYLACPYSSPEPKVEDIRFMAANRAAAKLMKAGYRVFSPISHSHPIAKYGRADLPRTYKFWVEDQDLFWLHQCDVLVVLMVEGYAKSHGVAKEIAEAVVGHIPVWFMAPGGRITDQEGVLVADLSGDQEPNEEESGSIVQAFQARRMKDVEREAVNTLAMMFEFIPPDKEAA